MGRRSEGRVERGWEKEGVFEGGVVDWEGERSWKWANLDFKIPTTTTTTTTSTTTTTINNRVFTVFHILTKGIPRREYSGNFESKHNMRSEGALLHSQRVACFPDSLGGLAY